MRKYRNNFSGLHAPGYRFRFRVQALAHRALFLPLQMKEDKAVIRILNGEDPCRVFDTDDIHEARNRFNSLRLRYDFPFWAATQFKIRHIDDADTITTLDLNEDQHHIIDTFLKRFHDKQVGRYIITKKGPACGLSTCVQAYIMWLQLYSNPKNSQICGLSNFHVCRFKENISRFQHKDTVPFTKRKFHIKDRLTSAFFNTFNKPDSLRGIDFGYVHLVDMANWRDSDGTRTSRAIAAAISGIWLDHRTLIVMEGNIPSPTYNPVFFNEVTYAYTTEKPKLFIPLHIP